MISKGNFLVRYNLGNRRGNQMMRTFILVFITTGENNMFSLFSAAQHNNNATKNKKTIINCKKKDDRVEVEKKESLKKQM